jgi:hypothetical protein
VIAPWIASTIGVEGGGRRRKMTRGHARTPTASSVKFALLWGWRRPLHGTSLGRVA